MNKDIRKKSILKTLPYILTAVILGIVLIACTGFSIFRIAAGPDKLTDVIHTEVQGEYIEAELNTVLDTFAESTVTTGSTTKTKRVYCVMSCGDDYYMVINLPGSYSDLMTAIAGEANSVYNGDIDAVGDYGSVVGTVTEIDSGISDYYTGWFSDVSYFDDEDQDYIDQHLLMYQLNVGKVGVFSESFVYAFTIIGAAFILIGLLLLLLAALGVFSAGLNKYLTANAGELTADDIGKDYLDARELDKRIRAGKHFVWYASGLGTKSISLEQTVWLYPRGKTLEEGKMRWTLVFCQKDKSERNIVTKDADVAQQLMDAAREAGYPLVTGFDADKKQLYDKDFHQFMQLAKKNAAK